VRHVAVRDGYTTFDSVCVFDNSGGAKGNPKCAPDRKLAVLTKQEGYDNIAFDGLLGLGRLPNPSDYDNQTQFFAGLVNASNKDGVAQNTAYLDMANKKVHFGEEDANSH
jgi:hypothetical protein